MNAPRSNLTQRVITALVVLPVVLTLIWVPALKPGFAALVGLVVLITLHEFAHLLRARQIPTHEPASLVGALAIVIGAWWADALYLNAGLVCALVLVGLAQVLSNPPSATGMAGAFASLLYTAWCPAHVLMLHQFDPEGAGLVMLLVVTVVLTDTAAYFTGKSIGKHKMAPIVSPKKTWEGAAGGLAFAVIGAVAIFLLNRRFGRTTFPEDWGLARYALTGAALSVVAQLSDLVKSTIKRDAGVKDSGHILPGHGGALDRFDGFLFAAPVLYYMTVI